jgi:hypothetical protein
VNKKIIDSARWKTINPSCVYGSTLCSRSHVKSDKKNTSPSNLVLSHEQGSSPFSAWILSVAFGKAAQDAVASTITNMGWYVVATVDSDPDLDSGSGLLFDQVNG